MDVRLSCAILASKVVSKILKVGGSGATAAPGLVATMIDPLVMKKLAAGYSDIVLISGTNGKTTTTHLLTKILEKSGIKFTSNRAGSNLARGVTASLAAQSSFSSRSDARTAVFEVDEAALPMVVSQLHPRIILLNNLFRDQLDRYGEIDTIRTIWEKMIRNLDKSTTLVLNADDPAIASLIDTKAKKVFYGVEDKSIALESVQHASDFLSCTNCHHPLSYQKRYLSHLGVYHCENCGFGRPRPDFSAEKIALHSLRGSNIKLSLIDSEMEVFSPLPGVYNVYNLLAASSAASILGAKKEKIKEAIEGFKAAFGRTETVKIGTKKIFISLVKNPTGFNEVIRTIFDNNEKKIALIAINDRLADGQDISWLWDVDFENLKGKIQKILVSGKRAADMNLRLKYADIRETTEISDLRSALEKSLSLAQNGETIYILPTYTAMLKLKALLSARGLGVDFWED